MITLERLLGESAVNGQLFITIEWFNAFKGSNSERKNYSMSFCTQYMNMMGGIYISILMKHGCKFFIYTIMLLKNVCNIKEEDIIWNSGNSI